MHKVRLTLVESKHSNIRVPTIDGFAQELPIIEEDFVMFSRALSKRFQIRLIHTTPILELSNNTFKTANSTYKIEPLPADYDVGITEEQVQEFLK